MGLDWCVNDKVIKGRETEYERLNAVYDDLRSSTTAAYNVWTTKYGHERPCYFPNPVTDEWKGTSDAVAFEARKDMLRKELAKCVVGPMETMKAPRVGHDEKADAFVRGQWEMYDDLQEEYPTVEDYLEASEGLYVQDLAESDGLGMVGGILVGAESFRGKIIGYTEWLPEDVRNQAYSDMSPEELMTYGAELIALGEEAGEQEDSDIVVSAGKWCVFWGSNGHSMHAWY